MQLFLFKMDRLQRPTSSSLSKSLTLAETIRKDPRINERIRTVFAWFADWNNAEKNAFIDLFVQRLGTRQRYEAKVRLHQPLLTDLAALLPHNVLLVIFSHLSVRDLCQVAQVSKRWAFAANDDIVWQRHIRKLTIQPMLTPSASETGYFKRFYMQNPPASSRSAVRRRKSQTDTRTPWQPASTGDRATLERMNKSMMRPTSPQVAQVQPQILSRDSSIASPSSATRGSVPTPSSSTRVGVNSTVPYSMRRNRLTVANESTTMSATLRSSDLEHVSRRLRRDTSDAVSQLDREARALNAARLAQQRVRRSQSSAQQPSASSTSTAHSPDEPNPPATDLRRSLTLSHLGSSATSAIVISSQLDNFQLLCDAVQPGILCIPIDYDAATPASLVAAIHARLPTPNTKLSSLAFACHATPKSLFLVPSCPLVRPSTLSTSASVSSSNSNVAAAGTTLWQLLASLVCRPTGGRIDFLIPRHVSYLDESLIALLESLAGGGIPVVSSPLTRNTGTVAADTGAHFFVPSRLSAWEDATAETTALLASAHLSLLPQLLPDAEYARIATVTGTLVRASITAKGADALHALTPVLHTALAALVRASPIADPVAFLRAHLSPESVKGTQLSLKNARTTNEVLWSPYGTETRAATLAELLQAHVRVLDLLRDMYMKPLRDATNRAGEPLWTARELKELFGTAFTDMATHARHELKAVMRARAGGGEGGDGHAELFASLKDSHVLHGRALCVYADAVPSMLSALHDKESQSELFRAFLMHTRSAHAATHNCALADLLCEPLRFALERTWHIRTLSDTCNDVNPLIIAQYTAIVDSSQQTCEHIHACRDADRRRTILTHLQRALIANSPDLTTNPHRRFVDQCDVVQLLPLTGTDSDDPEMKRKRKMGLATTFTAQQRLGLFLFSDMLLIAFRVDRRLPFGELEMPPQYIYIGDYSIDTIKSTELPNSAYDRNIVKFEIDGQETVVVQWCDKTARDKWTDLFRTTKRSRDKLQQ